MIWSMSIAIQVEQYEEIFTTPLVSKLNQYTAATLIKHKARPNYPSVLTKLLHWLPLHEDYSLSLPINNSQTPTVGAGFEFLSRHASQ